MNVSLPTIPPPRRQHRKLVRWLCPGLAWLAACFGDGGQALAESSVSLEYEVKGAFLVKFGMFVEWPTNAVNAAKSGTFLIGILGEDPFGTRFDEAVKKETVRGKSVQLKRAKDLAELAECQIVFICASESSRMPELLQALLGQKILTVADEPGFAGRGGMIGFIKEAGKIRFEINPVAAEKSGLKLSSKLLQVGRRVAGIATATAPG